MKARWQKYKQKRKRGKKIELNTQARASSSAAVDQRSHNRDAKSPKLPAFVDEKYELDSYLLHFERYAENAKWEKHVG